MQLKLHSVRRRSTRKMYIIIRQNSMKTMIVDLNKRKKKQTETNKQKPTEKTN